MKVNAFIFKFIVKIKVAWNKSKLHIWIFGGYFSS